MSEDAIKQVMKEVYLYINDFENGDSEEPRILRAGSDRDENNEQAIITGQTILASHDFKIAFCKLYKSDTFTDLKGLADLIGPIILPSIGFTTVICFGISIPIATAAPVIWYIVYKIWTKTGKIYCQDNIDNSENQTDQ
jgi:hypothetical protein